MWKVQVNDSEVTGDGALSAVADGETHYFVK